MRTDEGQRRLARRDQRLEGMVITLAGRQAMQRSRGEKRAWPSEGDDEARAAQRWSVPGSIPDFDKAVASHSNADASNMGKAVEPKPPQPEGRMRPAAGGGDCERLPED